MNGYNTIQYNTVQYNEYNTIYSANVEAPFDDY